MKTALLVTFAALLGIALGVGVAVMRLKTAPIEQQPKRKAAQESPEMPGPDEPAPKAVVAETDFDFGDLDINAKGSHDFVISNAGKSPLVLTEGETSCRCTMSKLNENEISPGGSTTVTISWKPTDIPGPYKQTAKILTNDPQKPKITLSISGRITTAMRFQPSELIFSRLSANDTAEGEARLFYYLDEQPKILDQKWFDESTAQFFHAELKPLSADDVKGEPLAKGGTLVRVTVKPGLPQGPIRQKLLLRTNAKTSPELALPVLGIVGGEIAVVGRLWDPDKGVLNLGSVSRAEGGEWKLFLVVRGKLRNQVEFKSVRSEPGELRATLGKPIEINSGAVVQVPLNIEIPHNSPPGSHLGSEQGRFGEITVETTHPNVPIVRIRVRYAIEG